MSFESPRVAPKEEPLELDQALRAEYERWLAEVGALPEPGQPYVTTKEVLHAHFLLAQFFQSFGEGMGGVGPRSMHLLESAVARQHVGLGASQKWTTPCEVAATLYFGLIKNHPFHDANKRTALLTALYQLNRVGRLVDAPESEFEKLTVHVAESSLATSYKQYDRFADQSDPEVRFIAWFFNRKTREMDKRTHIITYRQLDAILRRFGFRLDAPGPNQIGVWGPVAETSFLGLRTKRVDKRILTIGFHDWGAQVGKLEIKRVRDATRLTPEHNVDSKVFFEELDPMESLISVYSGPLKRLVKK